MKTLLELNQYDTIEFIVGEGVLNQVNVQLAFHRNSYLEMDMVEGVLIIEESIITFPENNKARRYLYYYNDDINKKLYIESYLYFKDSLYFQGSFKIPYVNKRTANYGLKYDVVNKDIEYGIGIDEEGQPVLVRLSDYGYEMEEVNHVVIPVGYFWYYMGAFNRIKKEIGTGIKAHPNLRKEITITGDNGKWEVIVKHVK